MSPARAASSSASADQRVDEADALVVRQVAVVLQDLRIGADGGDQRQDLVAHLEQEGVLAEALAEQVGAQARFAIDAIEAEDGARRPRIVGDQFGRVGGGEIDADAAGVGGDLAQLGDESRLLGAGQRPAVESDGVGDAVQQGAADRPLVVFDEVQVARRYADLAGEPLLRLAKLLASLANSVADRSPGHGRLPPL